MGNPVLNSLSRVPEKNSERTMMSKSARMNQRWNTRVEAFIIKVQRQGNVVPFAFPHAPKEDFNFKGYLFPKGTFMFFALDSVMTDPEIFPEPSKFKPERFLD